MSCERCTDRVVMPAADVAPVAGGRFHVRLVPLGPKDAGPCVLLALPDGDAMRWARLTEREAAQLVLELSTALELCDSCNEPERTCAAPGFGKCCSSCSHPRALPTALAVEP